MRAARICLPLAGVAAIAALAATTAQLPAQEQSRESAANTAHPYNRETQPAGDCLACHTCDQPTAEAPCLRMCTRPTPQDAARMPDAALGPRLVMLGELEDRFLPVPFDHQGHARMAEMTQGCTVCHHYTPQNAAHPACKTCHEKSAKHEDIHKPGLKGAYHRQCMNCHREWSGESQCDACHLPKADRAATTATGDRPSAGDIVGRMHPPIPEPDTEIYRAFALGATGGPSNVIFRHREHIHRFGLKCVECHQEDSCLRCHANGRQHTQRSRTVADHHQPCARCHQVQDENKCQRCHWQTGQPTPPPFDHASTGWKLNRHHSGLNCRVCHEAVPFRKLNRDCTSCHNWKAGEFDHGRIAGLVLDETHAEIECTDCHAAGNYEAPIRCTECHEDDIRYPNSMPGIPRAPSTESGAKAN